MLEISLQVSVLHVQHVHTCKIVHCEFVRKKKTRRREEKARREQKSRRAEEGKEYIVLHLQIPTCEHSLSYIESCLHRLVLVVVVVNTAKCQIWADVNVGDIHNWSTTHLSFYASWFHLSLLAGTAQAPGSIAQVQRMPCPNLDCHCRSE